MTPPETKNKPTLLWLEKLNKENSFIWLVILAIIFIYSCSICVGLFKIQRALQQVEEYKNNFEARISRIEALTNL